MKKSEAIEFIENLIKSNIIKEHTWNPDGNKFDIKHTNHGDNKHVIEANGGDHGYHKFIIQNGETKHYVFSPGPSKHGKEKKHKKLLEDKIKEII